MQEPGTRRSITVALEIDGEQWHRVESLADSGPDDRHFVVVDDDNGNSTIRFGDGAHGARLPTGMGQVTAVYESSRRFTAVLQQQGRVIVDQDWKENVSPNGACGLYRARVINAVDPLQLSRLQVQIAGLGNVLLWAVPCRAVDGHDVPAGGAMVWVAFEEADPDKPVWMGVAG